MSLLEALFLVTATAAYLGILITIFRRHHRRDRRD